MSAIIFDQETRTFSVVEDREFTSSNNGKRYRKYEARYNKLRSKGMDHDEAIRKLHKGLHRGHDVGQTLNVVNSVMGLSNYPIAKKISKTGSRIGVAGNLALHGGAGYYIEKSRKKGVNIINDIDNKHKGK